MRVILTARQGLTTSFEIILGHLVRIITEVSKNPSNPKFNHYAFESVSGLIRYVDIGTKLLTSRIKSNSYRFVVSGDQSSLSKFENGLFPPFQYILSQDVAEFSPFVFQILAQMLELHTTTIPDAYLALIPPLLMGTLWTQRGNVPALVRLVRAFLAQNAIADPSQINQIRDILRYLMPAKVSDQFSLELLEALYLYLPRYDSILIVTRPTQMAFTQGSSATSSPRYSDFMSAKAHWRKNRKVRSRFRQKFLSTFGVGEAGHGP